MSNLIPRQKSEISLAPSPVGATVAKMGAGALALSGVAWLMPGGIFLWAVIFVIAGLVF